VKWLLDTNVCIDVLRGREDVVAQMRKCSPDDLGISVVTGFELIQGVWRAPEEFREEEGRKVAAFLAKIRQVNFDYLSAHRAGEINAVLLNRGTPVSVTDVFIAATALEIGVPVITNNLRDFGRIDGLELVDWRG